MPIGCLSALRAIDFAVVGNIVGGIFHFVHIFRIALFAQALRELAFLLARQIVACSRHTVERLSRLWVYACCRAIGIDGDNHLLLSFASAIFAFAWVDGRASGARIVDLGARIEVSSAAMANRADARSSTEVAVVGYSLDNSLWRDGLV